MNLRKVADDPTKKEVMSGAIGELRAMTLNELMRTEDPEKIEELEERQMMLEYEEHAVLGNDSIARSIQDKVLRLYSPILKAYNGAK